VCGAQLAERVLNGGLEGGEVGVILAVHAVPLEEPPQALDQVQVGRVTGQVQQGQGQLGGQRLDHLVPLVSGVVQDHGHRTHQLLRRNRPEQLAHGVGVHNGRVRDRQECPGDRVPGTEHVEPLAPTGGPDEHPQDRPQAAQVRPVHAVGRVHEQHVPVPGHGRVQTRFQLGVEERALGRNVLAQFFFGGIGIARTRL
jgi:hypothetical protein